MRTEMSPQMIQTKVQLTSPAVQASLPRMEELPEVQRQELIQALAQAGCQLYARIRVFRAQQHTAKIEDYGANRQKCLLVWD